MNKPFEEIEFTPEDIYEELIKSGIEFELNEEYKYLEDSLTEYCNTDDSKGGSFANEIS